ncbi:hypothetical protein QTO34_019849 [Cnephaeus nilssonii]|uniref:Uncharacterized protein n=1 Tax=Cnephaeus nilssonii TaxID=3371016 RepID=A0AA40HXJ6_CNENI|nr:hypothetical protein QTO34_019849 [Eptesicus nilssonii]
MVEVVEDTYDGYNEGGDLGGTNKMDSADFIAYGPSAAVALTFVSKLIKTVVGPQGFCTGYSLCLEFPLF